MLCIGIAISGCGIMDDIGRLISGGSRQAENVPPPVRPGPEPVPVDPPVPAPGGGVAGQGQANQSAATLVLTHTMGLTGTEREQVVRAACFINDGYDYANADSLGDIVGNVLSSYGGRATLSARVSGLATSLRQAESSGDQFRILVAGTACEFV